MLNDNFDAESRARVAKINEELEAKALEWLHSETNLLNRAILFGDEKEVQRIQGLQAIGAVLEAIQSTTNTTPADQVRIAA